VQDGRTGIFPSAVALFAAATVVLALSSAFSRPSTSDAADRQRLEAVEDYIGCLERVAVVLRAVVDDESAASAAPTIRQVARRMAKLRQRIGRLQGHEREPIVRLYGDRLAAASERLRRETGRIGEEPHLARTMQVALAAVPPLT
jgi:hypothetical protein